MGELIAIPLPSERRAAAVLAALRRLEAEYLVAPPPAAVARAWIGGLLRPRHGRGLRGLQPGTGFAMAIGLALLTIAAISAAAGATVPWQGHALGAPVGMLPGLGLGLGLGLALGLSLALTITARQRRGRRRDAGSVTWLVSYVTHEPDGSGSGRVRTSAVRISLPEAAGWRLRAILERAAATAA